MDDAMGLIRFTPTTIPAPRSDEFTEEGIARREI